MKKEAYTITSVVRFGEKFGLFSEAAVKVEPMFHGADPYYARKYGGPITKAFLDAVYTNTREELRGEPGEHVVFDSKVTMLMPGWYPCIPGWHHDDVPRDTRDGQPNYDEPSYRPRHAMGLVNGEICPTDFATGTATFPGLPDGAVIYKYWHPEVVSFLRSDALLLTKIPSNRVIYFDDRSWHQGTPAIQGGWRWFGRLTWHTRRDVLNSLRTQVQVYLPSPFDGW